MLAMTVFSESIKYLKNHLLEKCCNMMVGLQENDIMWTLTVPAIWNDTAKLFMRRAAEEVRYFPICCRYKLIVKLYLMKVDPAQLFIRSEIGVFHFLFSMSDFLDKIRINS